MIRGIALLVIVIVIVAGFSFILNGTQASTNYNVYRVPEGDTVAEDNETGEVVVRGHYAGAVIQQALDAANGGLVQIESGDYDITHTLITSDSSLKGQGNDTKLIAHAGLQQAVISIHKTVGIRPNGLSVSNLEIDGNKTVQPYGLTIRGIEILDSLNIHVERVYAHNIISGQGVYMSNSQNCEVRDSWFSNIGDNLGSGSLGNYGSGVAFGTMRSVASSHNLIDNCSFSLCSMSSIDLEPANNITITNNRFTAACTWQNAPNPVITSYPIAGYAPNSNIIIAGNIVQGDFGEFVHLPDAANSLITDNWVKYTASNSPAIYSSGSTSTTISDNVIGTLSMNGIIGENCRTFTVTGNTIIDLTGSKSDYGIRFYSSGSPSTNHIISGNNMTGWNYGTTANQGSDYTTMQNNVFHGCNTGTWVTGTHNTVTGNVYNGAGVG